MKNVDNEIKRHPTRHLYLRRINFKQMATIKAILNKDKPKEKEEAKQKVNNMYPVYIRLHHQGKRKYVSIGRFVKEKDWDEEAGLVRKSNKNYVTINAIIHKEMKKLEDGVLWHLALEKTDDVVSGLRKKEKKEKMNDFFLLADEYFDELEKTNKYNRISAERPRVNHLKVFNHNNSLRFEEIDQALLKKFQVWLKSKYTCSDRTVMNHLVVIRTLYNRAAEEGIADKNLYPFGKGKIRIKFPESLKVGLNEQEVNLIEAVDYSKELHLQLAKDIWLFSFYLAGIRISDVLRLKWKDCIDQRLSYVMGKNNKVVSLKLPQKAVSILNRYLPAEQDYEGYVFDIFCKQDEEDAKRMYLKIVSGTHKINTALKTIAKRLKIKKKLTCHISRHTFGNITGDKISPQMLQKLYRHTDIKTSMGYQANFIHKDVDDALESVLNF